MESGSRTYQFQPNLRHDEKECPSNRQNIAWSRGDLAANRRWNIAPERLAFELLFWTGVRISGAVRLNAGMIDSTGWLEFKQQKTGGMVAVPFLAAAPAFSEPDSHLHDTIDANPRGNLPFIVTHYGSPRTVKGGTAVAFRGCTQGWHYKQNGAWLAKVTRYDPRRKRGHHSPDRRMDRA